MLPAEGQVVFGGLYVQDMATTLLDALVISIGILTVLFAPDYLVPRRLPMAEFCATLLFAISGAMLLWRAARTCSSCSSGSSCSSCPATSSLASRSATGSRPRARSSTSCWARSRARSSSSGSRSSSGTRAPPRSAPISDALTALARGCLDLPARARDGPRAPGGRASSSRSPLSRSTTGRPTRTRARPRP